MNAVEMQKFINKHGRYKVNGLLFDVKVIDVRTRFGTHDFLIQMGRARHGANIR